MPASFPPLAPILWYLPSFYGDIRLKRKDKKGEERTIVTWEKTTPGEQKALISLNEIKKGWSANAVVDAGLICEPNGTIELAVRLDKVQKFLSRALKPGRCLIDFVKFADGHMAETFSTEVRGEVETRIADLPTGKEDEKPAAKAVAGATVARPTLGCPEPSLLKADLRATEVLFAFLTPDQQEDFNDHNAFVTEGAGTGHRYMVTSRHATDYLSHYRRQLYDLDEKRPYCVHDYIVPAPEEMLALHLLLQSPEHERYLRHLD